MPFEDRAGFQGDWQLSTDISKLLSANLSSVTGIEIIEVDLDEFTTNVVKGSKDLFKFCELNWNDEILNFYKRKDLFSKTISSSQIRQEISQKHKSSYNKYYFLLNKV